MWMSSKFVVDSRTSTKNFVISTNVVIHLKIHLLFTCLFDVRIPYDNLKKIETFQSTGDCVWKCVLYRGADKSLARRGRKQARKHVRDARDFNNIETRAVIKFLFLKGKAPKEIHSVLTETLACFLPGRAKDLSAPLSYLCFCWQYPLICSLI